MDNEFKDFTATPTLTFDVAPETKEAPAPTASSELAEQAADPAFSENNLTPEELQMVNEFSCSFIINRLLCIPVKRCHNRCDNLIKHIIPPF